MSCLRFICTVCLTQEEGETFLAGGVEMTSWSCKRTASSRILTSRDESEGEESHVNKDTETISLVDG